MALGKLPMKPDMLSGQLNANTVPNFTSPQTHMHTPGAVPGGHGGCGEREGRGDGEQRGLGMSLEQG